jgi:hypothetical protein
MKNIVVSDGQNLLDITIRYYGTTEGLFLFLSDNPELNINTTLYAGQVVRVRNIAELPIGSEAKREIVRYFDNLNYTINTGDDAGKEAASGIGYWIIENDFEAQ